ncbi:hypothetical protein D8M31_11115, partial [Corynebacterium genitalium]
AGLVAEVDVVGCVVVVVVDGFVVVVGVTLVDVGVAGLVAEVDGSGAVGLEVVSVWTGVGVMFSNRVS